MEPPLLRAGHARRRFGDSPDDGVRRYWSDRDPICTQWPRRMIPCNGRSEGVVIVGAGISGLALAYRLKRLGIHPAILDAAPRIAETWRRRHEQLRLNTHRHYSRLPGRSLPPGTGAHADREAIIRYLENHARSLCQAIDLGVRVSRIDRFDGQWHLQTTEGTMTAHHVVIATGRERVPVIPRWPGLDCFRGAIRHSSGFGNVEDYRDRRILVVGGGNSAVDVLNHLVRIRTREISLAIRGRVTILPTRLWGIPVQRSCGMMRRLPSRVTDRILAATERIAFGNLARFGLPPCDVGAATRLERDGVVPAMDDGFVSALKDGLITVVPAVEELEHETVMLSNRQILQPDIVICATGYRPGLEGMVGHLNVLDGNGMPRFHGGAGDDELPGLWFLGMRPHLCGTFEAARRDSRSLARTIAHDLASNPGSVRAEPPGPSMERRYAQRCRPEVE